MYLLIKVRGKFNISVSADRQHVEESFGLRRASTMFNFDLMIDATLTASQATAIQFSQREFSNLPKHKTKKNRTVSEYYWGWENVFSSEKGNKET